MIQISGTLAGKFSRKTTGTADWLEARRLADAFENAGSWTGDTPSVPEIPEAKPERTKTRIPLVDGRRVFLANRASANLARATFRKYHTFAKQITGYGESKGYLFLDQITADDIDLFWANWKLGPRAKGKRLTQKNGGDVFAYVPDWLRVR